MVLLLTLTKSETEIISGIPEYVEFSVNSPSTVFYTIDGMTPTDGSDIAVNKVYLPTDGIAFTLKAIAISDETSSDVLEEYFFTDSTEINRARNIGDEGINILLSGEEPIDSLYYDADGNPVQEIAIERDELDFRTSVTDHQGIPLAEKSLEKKGAADFINFADRSIGPANSLVSSIHDPEFDPNASVIIIDGSTEALLNSQVVKVLNRPHDTMMPVSKFYDDHLKSQPLVSGGFVRSMHNPNTGKTVFYYRESRENRWIKSIQNVSSKKLNLDTIGNRFTFKWIEDRAMSKIY